MKSNIIDQAVSRLVARATPGIQEEMRAMLEGQSQWERVQRHSDQWIELPAGLVDGSRWQPGTPLKVRPGSNLDTLLLSCDGPCEVKIQDLQRLLAVVEEGWAA